MAGLERAVPTLRLSAVVLGVPSSLTNPNVGSSTGGLRRAQRASGGMHRVTVDFRAEWTDRELQLGLEGSPYSIPPAVDEDHVGEMLKAIQYVSAEAMLARYKLKNDIRTTWLKKNRRVRELHESNRVEGLGPERLSRTKEILESKSAEEIEAAINRYTVIRSLQCDQRTLDVLGLHGGKLFADEVMSTYPSRPIMEIDIRGMHGLIMGNHPTAGQYKVWLNAIQGADHTPLSPLDARAAMGDLVQWLNETVQGQRLPPVVTAAAVHAWLAHIHPFEDGNGRVSRLLANIVVGASALPPLIVQMAADRNRYIDALAISDKGGDLAPLVGVFLRIQKRAIADMRDPDFANRIFDDEVAERTLSLYVRWRKTSLAWLEQLGGALRLHDLRMRFHPNEMMTQESFERMRKGSRGEGIVFGGIGNEDRYPSCRAYLLLDHVQETTRYSEGEPVLSFLRYGPQPWSRHVYERMNSLITEIIIRPDEADGVYVRHASGRVEHLAGVAAAQLVAEALAHDFRAGRAQAQNRRMRRPTPL